MKTIVSKMWKWTHSVEKCESKNLFLSTIWFQFIEFVNLLVNQTFSLYIKCSGEQLILILFHLWERTYHTFTFFSLPENSCRFKLHKVCNKMHRNRNSLCVYWYLLSSSKHCVWNDLKILLLLCSLLFSMATLDAEVLQPQHINMCTLNGGFTNRIAFYVIDPSI